MLDCRRNNSGFTLLELVISIALIGIIVVIVIGAMRLAAKSIESGEKRIESLERMRTSLNIIDSQIESYVPLTYEDNAEKKYYFKGEQESMLFSTNFSIWGGEGICHSYLYRKDAAERKAGVVRYRKRCGHRGHQGDCTP